MSTSATPNTQYNLGDFIPTSKWARDHWSTLAYIDSVCVEYAGKIVAPDPRMKCNLRIHPKLVPAHVYGGWNDSYSTKLNDDTCVVGHDDWCCVKDMIEAGLMECVTDLELPNALQNCVTCNEEVQGVRDFWVALVSSGLAATDDQEFFEGKVLHLTQNGLQAMSLLREHKSAGQNFDTFVLPIWATPIVAGASYGA